MKKCLIFQPIGLGDILFVQGIVEHLIKNGYEVHFPVHKFYFSLVKEYIVKNNLIWHNENGKYPLSEHYGKEQEASVGEDIYLPLTFADCYSRTQPMISKYFYMNIPVDDWRKGFDVQRKLDKEKELIKKYNLKGRYIIVNKQFNMPELKKKREINIESNLHIHEMSYEEDLKNGFTLFDWIGALENAEEVHTVGTSVSYLVDKYCINNKIYCYERRLPGQDRTYHEEIHLVHRNPNWIYMD